MSLIRKILKKTWARDIILLVFAYFLVHGFMLFLTGTFWDDWLSYFRDATTKNLEGLESGRPYYSLVIEIVWLLPGYGYRILMFFTYLASYLFIYGTFCKIRKIRHRKALAVALICMAVPINDARVLLANYPYALGMLLFWAACFVLIKNIDRLKNIWSRLVILLLFFCSFSLNSNLMLYGIVLLYLMITRCRFRVYKIVDFIALPIVFFVISKIFFPAYGAYQNYNAVTADKLLWTICSIPKMLANTLASIFGVISDEGVLLWLAIMATAVALVAKFFFVRKNAHACSTRSKRKTKTNNSGVYIFCFGLIALILGLFPYVVVRRDVNIEITGIQGRDSMQIGIGIALMLVGMVNRRMREPLAVLIVMVGCLHFNVWYLRYQTEWWTQLAFQRKVDRIDEMGDGGNFIVRGLPDSSINDRRFYSWSGNVAAVTGRRNAFVLDGDKDLATLNDSESMESILTHFPMLNEYEYDHTNIDGEFYFSASYSLKNTLKLKMYEMFDRDKMYELLDSLYDIKYRSLNDNEQAFGH